MEPKYTLETFLELLKEEAKDWKFELRDGLIRACDRKGTKCGCPVDVAFHKENDVNWVNADSEYVNFLSRVTCDLIITAADNDEEQIKKLPPYHHIDGDKLAAIALRKQLLEITGLTEISNA